MNVIMNEVNLLKITDSDYLKGASSWAITNLPAKYQTHLHSLTTLSKKQLKQLLRIPFLHLEQLV
jgi:hypothetical protein